VISTLLTWPSTAAPASNRPKAARLRRNVFRYRFALNVIDDKLVAGVSLISVIRFGERGLMDHAADARRTAASFSWLEKTGSSSVRYFYFHSLLPDHRYAIAQAAPVVRSSLDPSLCQHAGDCLLAGWVQFFKRQRLGGTHLL
jgi:hypothetical protein